LRGIRSQAGKPLGFGIRLGKSIPVGMPYNLVTWFPARGCLQGTVDTQPAPRGSRSPPGMETDLYLLRPSPGNGSLQGTFWARRSPSGKCTLGGSKGRMPPRSLARRTRCRCPEGTALCGLRKRSRSHRMSPRDTGCTPADSLGMCRKNSCHRSDSRMSARPADLSRTRTQTPSPVNLCLR
jgi:hypothetical protein